MKINSLLPTFLVVIAFASFSEGYTSRGINFIGGGGGGKVYQIDQYETKKGDLKMEGSVYKTDSSGYSFEPFSILYLQHGVYMGIEINEYTVRPYLGLTELVFGVNVKYIPILYFGVSAGTIVDFSQFKDYYSDVGIEGSLWLATLMGTFQITERVMVQEYYQTRIDYLFKFPFFDEQQRKKPE